VHHGHKKVIFIVGLVALGFLYYSNTQSYVRIEPAFDGKASDLEKTKIVATLDAPLEQDMNTIWFASFVATWKKLEIDIIKEPTALEGDPEIALALNKAPDPHQYMPEESLYTASGWNNKGIVKQCGFKLLVQHF
jgi:hypothetical protein